MHFPAKQTANTIHDAHSKMSMRIQSETHEHTHTHTTKSRHSSELEECEPQPEPVHKTPVQMTTELLVLFK